MLIGNFPSWCILWKFHCVKVMGECSSSVYMLKSSSLKAWVNFHPRHMGRKFHSNIRQELLPLFLKHFPSQFHVKWIIQGPPHVKDHFGLIFWGGFLLGGLNVFVWFLGWFPLGLILMLLFDFGSGFLLGWSWCFCLIFGMVSCEGDLDVFVWCLGWFPLGLILMFPSSLGVILTFLPGFCGSFLFGWSWCFCLISGWFPLRMILTFLFDFFGVVSS